jgi:two-component system NarL family response regulator
MRTAILIVEDHDALRFSMREWLSAALPDCRFSEAKSGEEAVTQTLAHPPDIVLMDIGLPKMNGIEATRRIKAIAPRAQVVMVTFYEAIDYQADALAAGASAYVVKYRMHDELIPVLTTLLSNPVPAARG